MCTSCQQKKRIGLLVGGIIAAVAFYVLFSANNVTAVASGKPVVSVSTFALYEVANAVAGDTLKIRSIIPLGSDAHMFSPTPKEVAEVSNSALFIYSGAGFESWAQPLAATLGKTTRIIDMSTHVALLKSDGESFERHEDHEGDAQHAHGGYDPHYWLDIDNMITMTNLLVAEFSELSPKNASLYRENGAAYVEKLEKLKSDYLFGLKECKNRILVSNHDAFGYLARANGLEAISVIGLSSDEQPSAKTIAQIIALVQEHRIQTIFFEELINDNVAQTIAKETGAKAVSLQPLENISEDELKSHQTYESIMRQNLAKLAQAMECR
ncbi:MAG TPA: zinc ABC transporter substrate-binding protein [Sulfuricurvum sp.]|nr:zinc ABC transporter substrate-binding protein [Sulfuricurvum sp.]